MPQMLSMFRHHHLLPLVALRRFSLCQCYPAHHSMLHFFFLLFSVSASDQRRYGPNVPPILVWCWALLFSGATPAALVSFLVRHSERTQFFTQSAALQHQQQHFYYSTLFPQCSQFQCSAFPFAFQIVPRWGIALLNCLTFLLAFFTNKLTHLNFFFSFFSLFPLQQPAHKCKTIWICIPWLLQRRKPFNSHSAVCDRNLIDTFHRRQLTSEETGPHI